MAFTELYCNSASGANVNGGSDSGSPSMSDTAGTGSWTSATQVYISVATNGTVTVGQFMSIYSGAATIPTTTARITAVTGGGGVAWHITLSNTAYSGTQPSVLATGATYKAQVGGAWKGPNGAEGHPFGYVSSSMTNAAGDMISVNFKNNATYSITSQISHTSFSGPFLFSGYATAPRDGGKATIDGGAGGGFDLLHFGPSSGVGELKDFILQNNGGSGSNRGVNITGGVGTLLERVIINSMRGDGLYIQGGAAVECEIWACNLSNSGGEGGVRIGSGNFVSLIRCIAHDNTGSNCFGFLITGVSASLVECIADTNGKYGIEVNGSVNASIKECTVYNNTSDGIETDGNINFVVVENCTIGNNGGYGINNNDTGSLIRASNCGFYSNTSGQTHGVIDASGTITYASQPMNDPANGDFSLVTGNEGRGTGRGNFTQTASQYTKTTTASPDVGAWQGTSAGGATTIVINKQITQYLLDEDEL